MYLKYFNIRLPAINVVKISIIAVPLILDILSFITLSFHLTKSSIVATSMPIQQRSIFCCCCCFNSVKLCDAHPKGGGKGRRNDQLNTKRACESYL